MARSWAEIDLEAVGHNVRMLRAVASPARLCAVVKANGYGHGAAAVGRAALDGGADWLAVAQVEEAVVLRDAGIEAPLLLLSEPHPDEVADAVDVALEVVAPVDGTHAAGRAGHDHVARLKFDQRRQIADGLGHLPDLLGQVALLAQLAVDAQPDRAGIGMADGSDGADGAQRGGAVEALGHVPRSPRLLGLRRTTLVEKLRKLGMAGGPDEISSGAH